jgi:hypothetical protein
MTSATRRRAASDTGIALANRAPTGWLGPRGACVAGLIGLEGPTDLLPGERRLAAFTEARVLLGEGERA